MVSEVSTVKSSSMTTSRPATTLGVAMVSTDVVADVAVTTALMVACAEEDIEEVRKLLLAADEVRVNSA